MRNLCKYDKVSVPRWRKKTKRKRRKRTKRTSNRRLRFIRLLCCFFNVVIFACLLCLLLFRCFFLRAKRQQRSEVISLRFPHNADYKKTMSRRAEDQEEGKDDDQVQSQALLTASDVATCLNSCHESSVVALPPSFFLRHQNHLIARFVRTRKAIRRMRRCDDEKRDQ